MTTGAQARHVVTDAAPGSSCAGFPDGATRVTADADLHGKEVTLVCDRTTWNEAAGGDEIEQVLGLSALTFAPICIHRTAKTSTAIITVSCKAAEIMTGGGCGHSSTTAAVEDSRPSAAATWSCEWSAAAATGTAYAVCCSY